MADNTTLNAMTGGDVIASDDIAGVKHQQVKVEFGADGTATPASDANPFPTKLSCQAFDPDTTTTPLANGASYTTKVFDSSCAGPGMTFIFVADQTANLEFLESHDDITYYTADSAAYPGGNYVFNEMHVAHARYWKIKVTNNSGSAMTAMTLQCIQRLFGVPWKFKLDEAGNGVAVNSIAVGANIIGLVGIDQTTPGTSNGVQVNAALPTGANAIGKLAANSGVDIGDVDVLSMPAMTIAGSQTLTTVTTVGTVTGGGVAHGGADSGNPLKVGAKVETQLSTVTITTDANRTDIYADSDGVQYVKLVPEADIITERVADTGGTSTAFTNFGATASTRNLVYVISIFNASATDGYVDFRDGAAGAILFTVPAPKGGGAVLCSSTPIFKTTANTALAYDVSGALTTVYISISGRKSKVT